MEATQSNAAQTLAETGLDISFINEKLSSKKWRLNNLYTISDKDGKLRTLRLNESQIDFLESSQHKRKIVLKSRQRGITTCAVVYNLDSCIFTPGFSAGVQSYGKTEAKKLQAKAKLAWEKFDPNIKKLLGITLVVDNQEGMVFSNGSHLRIGNFRGDTLQSLHVSELAKIAKKYPDKAQELKTGAFQAVSINNRITIESTAEGKSGLFYEMWVKAVARKEACDAAKEPLSPFDFYPIFQAWFTDSDCQMNIHVPISDKINAYLDSIEQQCHVKLTQQQRWWYAAKCDELGEDIRQEYPSTAEEAFMQPLEGTYYQAQFKRLKIQPVQHIKHYKVHLAADLGVRDKFAIGMFQVDHNKQVYLLDELIDDSMRVEEYKQIIDAIFKDRGWTLGTTFVPFDANTRELIAGSRIKEIKRLGFNPVIVKKHKLLDGIEITRELLSNIIIDPRCEATIAAIQGYRKQYNEKYKVFLDNPVHDEFSHPADMLRYMAMGLKNYPLNDNLIVDTRKVYQRYSCSGLDL